MKVARLFLSLLTAACPYQGNHPIRCETDRSLADVDRSGDGALTPEDLEPGESAVAVRLESVATGEVVGTLYSHSTTDYLSYSPGAAPLRPWMAEYAVRPSWNLLHDMEELCRTSAAPQIVISSTTDDPTGPLSEGQVQNSAPSFSIEEYWTTDTFVVDGVVIITDIQDGAAVSGHFDGTVEGTLFDLFEEQYVDTKVIIEGFAWRSIAGEHLEP